jgi:hypothetical protein
MCLWGLRVKMVYYVFLSSSLYLCNVMIWIVILNKEVSISIVTWYFKGFVILVWFHCCHFLHVWCSIWSNKLNCNWWVENIWPTDELDKNCCGWAFKCIIDVGCYEFLILSYPGIKLMLINNLYQYFFFIVSAIWLLSVWTPHDEPISPCNVLARWSI